ncbi:uncharacterized protein CEXT_753441 [Caerostris extrusa]|uniref:Uncharacterized protein n=1 Tax=Caerostris extrusa TaxID=172846 RepID=A0AAV4PPV9_CAEEX|nr:uncharacterized protein CEXT_753441 [Caerostris extrusa]
MGPGCSFPFYGVLVYHLLNNFFLDDFGLHAAGTITYLSMSVGTFLVLVSFVTNFVIMFPSTRNYGLFSSVARHSFWLHPVIHDHVLHHRILLHPQRERSVARRISPNHEELQRQKPDQHLYKWNSHTTTTIQAGFKRRGQLGKIQVPESCCKRLKQCHNLEPLVISDIYEKGCFRVFDNYSKIVDGSYIGTIVGSIVIQSLAIVAAIKMALRYKAIRVIDSVLPMV